MQSTQPASTWPVTVDSDPTFNERSSRFAHRGARALVVRSRAWYYAFRQIMEAIQSVGAHWARELGLAATPLFGVDARPNIVGGHHFAILDGRLASFACTELADGFDPTVSRNWRWSADLAHHVLIDQETVGVWSGKAEVRRFKRAGVESQLDDFLRYLEGARGATLPDVVDFLLYEFRSMWGLMSDQHLPGHAALGAFLTALKASQVNRAQDWFFDRFSRTAHAEALGLTGELVQVVHDLPEDVIEYAGELGARAPMGLHLEPALSIRHVGGRLFQEAHGYLESAQRMLFGGATVTTVPTFSPTGAYFTPVPLARLLADLALAKWNVLPPQLTIADYACGSAVFLTEALHALERRAYRGRVRLVGRDSSAEAIIMANVAINSARSGIDSFAVDVDLELGDAMDGQNWPHANIVLMNPPFRSWERMDSKAKSWVTAKLGKSKGRPDLSVAFIQSAMDALEQGGVLATLLPVGVLSSEGLQSWRNDALDRWTLTEVGVLGEHDLFRHALVNVGLAVLRKHRTPRNEQPVHIAWASADSGAASNMMRSLRRRTFGVAGGMDDRARPEFPEWTVTSTTLHAWKERPTWLPGPSALGPLHADICRAITTRVGDLFKVHQGIRTGAVDVFLITAHEYQQLPKIEKQYFVPAVDNGSFDDGELLPKKYLFVADRSWSREADVKSAVPTYYEKKLLPARSKLSRRKGMASNTHWWQLTRPRGWSLNGKPAIVSKRFGLLPAFARELTGKWAVVQGNVWAPHDEAMPEEERERLSDVLTAYWWLLNSRVFVALLREYCPNVAGGQLNLEHMFVKHVPLPDLSRVLRDSPRAQEIAAAIRTSEFSGLPRLIDRDSFAAAAYGTRLDAWPIESA